MGLLRSLFGPSQEEIWRQLAGQIDGAYVDGGWLGSDKVVARVGQWTVTLDTYSVSHGKHRHTYTRLRAPYVNRDGLHFEIYRQSVFSAIGKFLGMQDIQIGDAFFDEAFVIKANDEQKVRALLANPRIKELLHAQPDVSLSVKEDEGWFGADFPEGVDELHFSARGVIRDVHQLHCLYLLFSEILHHLCAIGSAYENDPGVRL